MRILLTGGGGQLATDLESCLRGNEVVPLTHAQLDICDPAAVRAQMERHRPEFLINTAAYNRVDEAEENPDTAFQVNAVGVYHLARAAAAVGAVLVHFSTDYVFDGTQRKPYRESDTPNPLSVYALSKRAGEMIVPRYCEKYFLIRTCGLYGPTGKRSQGGNFVERMLRRAREGKPLRVVNDQVLTPTSTRDLAQKLLPLLQSDRYGLYHMTNAGECSWYDFAREILRRAGLSSDLQPISTKDFGAKARRPPYSVLDNYAYRAAGFDDFRSWQEALADYFQQTQPGQV
ncbi:dTDP-4-dehydrorhamnose reductase [Acidobacteriia bacterium AH_259_A11_L15]|nr:dTDP-4-dehydrorhamnose reductase [Acidobacteriia bacterium AH_259_A11_L15]